VTSVLAKQPWLGLAGLLFVVPIAAALAVVGQVVVGHADLRGLVDPTPGVGHTPTYPVLLPIGAAAFTAMLQLTRRTLATVVIVAGGLLTDAGLRRSACRWCCT